MYLCCIDTREHPVEFYYKTLYRVNMGLLNINEWRYVPGNAFCSKPLNPLIAVVIYLTITFSIQSVMPNRNTLEIRSFVFLHNLLLCSSSFILAVWLTSRIIWFYSKGFNTYQLICSKDIFQDGNLQFIYYINMFFKM